uniref:Uncharacterized protein n=1 Tax=Glossina pallidipes TaxID=7398 RepID=A0A1B0AJA0_GLOPL
MIRERMSDVCTKQSLVCLTEEKEVRTRRRVCRAFSQNFNNNFCLSSCLDNIKEAGKYARYRKEIKGAASCPCKFNSTYMLRINMYLIKKVLRDQIGQPKIPRTSAGTSVYPRVEELVTAVDDETATRLQHCY